MIDVDVMFVRNNAEAPSRDTPTSAICFGYIVTGAVGENTKLANDGAASSVVESDEFATKIEERAGKAPQKRRPLLVLFSPTIVTDRVMMLARVLSIIPVPVESMTTVAPFFIEQFAMLTNIGTLARIVADGSIADAVVEAPNSTFAKVKF